MNKAEILQELYPEDLLRYSEKLTEKEVDLLVKLREILETKLEPVIEEHWKNETFPFEEFKAITDLGLMNHPDLFEGREGEHKVREYFNLFRLYELARTDTSLATFLRSMQALAIRHYYKEVRPNKLRIMGRSLLLLKCKHALV